MLTMKACKRLARALDRIAFLQSRDSRQRCHDIRSTSAGCSSQSSITIAAAGESSFGQSPCSEPLSARIQVPVLPRPPRNGTGHSEQFLTVGPLRLGRAEPYMVRRMAPMDPLEILSMNLSVVPPPDYVGTSPSWFYGGLGEPY